MTLLICLYTTEPNRDQFLRGAVLEGRISHSGSTASKSRCCARVLGVGRCSEHNHPLHHVHMFPRSLLERAHSFFYTTTRLFQDPVDQLPKLLRVTGGFAFSSVEKYARRKFQKCFPSVGVFSACSTRDCARVSWLQLHEEEEG